jgi:F-type H+-transporting ATPase subunit delta
VTDQDSLVSGVARRYASALFELAREAGEIDATERGLDRFAALVDESRDLGRLVASPVFGADEQLAGVSAVLDKAGIGGVAGNFIKLVAKNRRLFAVGEMIRAYRALAAEHRGETVAEVTSAEPLSDTHAAALTAALGEATGRTVLLKRRIDASLIGGLIVKIGSRMIDTSLKTKLNSLRIAMKEVG